MLAPQSHLTSEPSPSVTIGMWDEEEHCRFLRGVVQFGKDWKAVRQVIGTRREKQIQSHYQKYSRRIAKIVKKIKRKSNGHHFDDDLLVTEQSLYRKLFTPQDITTLTPSQMKAMILCVCPTETYRSPKKTRNIIITKHSEPTLNDSIHSQNSSLSFIGTSKMPVTSALIYQDSLATCKWSPKPRSFFLTQKQRQFQNRCDHKEQTVGQIDWQSRIVEQYPSVNCLSGCNLVQTFSMVNE